MAQQIIKETTNKVQIWENGKIRASLLENASYRVVGDEIIIRDTAGQVASLFYEQVTYTQLKPAAKVAASFASPQELAAFLDANFFFSLIAEGGGSELAAKGDTGQFFSPQGDMVQPLDSSSFAANFYHLFPVYFGEDMTLTEFAVGNRLVTGFDVVFGLYNLADRGLASLKQYPNELVWQSSVLSFTVNNEVITDAMANVQVSEGWYVIIMQHNNGVSVPFRGIDYQSDYWGVASTLDYIQMVNVSGTYSATLPDPFPTSPLPNLVTATVKHVRFHFKKSL